MILIIDNYDSFSYNLYQLFGTIQPDIRVIRNELLHLMVKSSVAQNKTNRDTIQLDFLQRACKVA